jgi:hypothetical protein
MTNDDAHAPDTVICTLCKRTVYKICGTRMRR